MKAVSRCILFIAALLVLGSSLVAQVTKPRLAIRPFENPTTDANSNIGNAITDILITELAKKGKFQIVERAAMDEIAREIDFGSSDMVNKSTAAKRGGIAGAEYILVGKVSNFSYKETVAEQAAVNSRRGAQVTMYKQEATVRVDFRVISVSTGVAVVAESGMDTQSNVSATSELVSYRRYREASFSVAEAQNSLIGRTTIGAITNIVRKISDLSGRMTAETDKAGNTNRAQSLSAVSGQISSVTADAVFIDFGNPGHGVQRGDRLKVVEEKVTKNSKGKVVFQEEKEVGILEVLSVNGKNAKARLASDSNTDIRDLREGDKIRVDVESIKAGVVKPGSVATGSSGGSRNAIQKLLRDGNRYVEDKHFAEAIDVYQQALELDPNSPEVMDRLVSAFLYNKNLGDAEDMIDRLFAQSGSVNMDVIHNHTFGYCTGTLTIAYNRISYRPAKGDHQLDLRREDIYRFDEGQHMGQPPLPTIIMRFRDERGKEKKWDLLVPAYMQCQGTVMADINQACKGNAEDVSDTSKLHRMIIRLAQDKVLKH
jgi:curli biogenesis system outer membrane secretion channel CsgG